MSGVTPRFKKLPEPPKRRAHNSTLAAATAPIAPMSKQRKKSLEGYSELKAALIERARGRCEMGDYGPHAEGCNGVGQDPHHILPRSLGGEHTLENLVWLSRRCHDLAELNPAGSIQTGVSKGTQPSKGSPQ